MRAPGLPIRLAGPQDIAALMEPEGRHRIGNLDPAERTDGFRWILHRADWFSDTAAPEGAHGFR